MTRLNKKGELWSHISLAQALRDQPTSPGSTTLTAAAAVGAGTLTVAAITNFAVAEPIRIGRGEDTEYSRVHPSTAPAALTITLDAAMPLRYAHAIGDPVVELLAVDVGHLEEGGLDLDLNGTTEDVKSATQRLLLGQLAGYQGIGFSFGLLGYALENFAFAFGMNETRVLGSGTAAAPRTLTVDFSKAREQNDIALQFLGVRKDGMTMRITAMACELDPSTMITLARGTKVPIPIKGRSTGGLLYEAW